MQEIILLILGLIAGSFINALVWRVHYSETSKNNRIKYSILNGRSICPNCKHELSYLDLIPVLSWIMLKGKCRYCKKTISKQYPIVEIVTSLLFVASYIYWPIRLNGIDAYMFIVWLISLVGLVALSVYDIKWFILPNKIIFTLYPISILFVLLNIINSNNLLKATINASVAFLIGGGIFYVIFQISQGKWIGGGDVKLGGLLGLLALTPAKSILFIFLASIIGCLVSLVLILIKRMKRNSLIPFGPFLIAGLYITVLFGQNILNWYTSLYLVK